MGDSIPGRRNMCGGPGGQREHVGSGTLRGVQLGWSWQQQWERSLETGQQLVMKGFVHSEMGWTRTRPGLGERKYQQVPG